MSEQADGLTITLSRLQFLSLAFVGLFALILINASVMEDPYITYRIVDNFIHGDGLRWSVDERVQPSTSPLWMLVHIPFYFVWQNIYVITLLLSLLCAFGAVVIPLYTFRRPVLAVAGLFILPLALSDAFVKYSTSGFENSLQHLLFAWFGWVLLRAQPRYFWFLLTCSVSLSMVNRFDALILYAPIGAYLLCTRFRVIRWWQACIGALPIVLWELFSLFYYGALFANSKYAKLNTDISDSEYLRLGIGYLRNIVVVDFISALSLFLVVASIPVLVWFYKKGSRAEDRDRFAIFACLAAGILGYTIYVAYIGGTYLGGRLLSLPVYASLWMMLGLADRPIRCRTLAGLALVLVALKLCHPDPDEIRKQCGECFIGINMPKDEEKIYLADYLSGTTEPPAPRVNSWYRSPTVAGSIGRWAYAMKPEIKIVDYIAIGDPLLARLPCNITRLGTIGILPRDIPEGYLHFLKTGDMSQMDSDLAAYYSKLRLIISGELWSMERIKEIFRFNRGDYDIYRDRYVEKMKAAKHAAP